MKLSDKLDSIPRTQTIPLLAELLEGADVSISWWGERLVSVKNYTGSVEINRIVRKYLDAHPSSDESHNLKERLDFFNLWTKIEILCKSNNTWAYQCVVPLKDFWVGTARVGCCGYRFPYRNFIVEAETDKRGSKFSSKESWAFQFTPEKFRELWPIEALDPKNHAGHLSWTATKEMIEAAISRCNI